MLFIRQTEHNQWLLYYCGVDDARDGESGDVGDSLTISFRSWYNSGESPEIYPDDSDSFSSPAASFSLDWVEPSVTGCWVFSFS